MEKLTLGTSPCPLSSRVDTVLPAPGEATAAVINALMLRRTRIKSGQSTSVPSILPKQYSRSRE